MRMITSKSGKQITLRSLEESDVEILFACAKDLESEDTYVTLDPHEPVTWEDQQTYIAGNVKKIANRDQVLLMAFDGDRLVGVAQMDRWGKRQRHVGRFGISVHRDYRGDGIGKQLMQAVMRDANDEMNVRTVMLTCFATNKPAQALYEGLGFRRCGTTPLGLYHKGAYIDQLHYFKHIFEE